MIIAMVRPFGKWRVNCFIGCKLIHVDFFSVVIHLDDCFFDWVMAAEPLRAKRITTNDSNKTDLLESVQWARGKDVSHVARWHGWESEAQTDGHMEKNILRITRNILLHIINVRQFQFMVIIGLLSIWHAYIKNRTENNLNLAYFGPLCDNNIRWHLTGCDIHRTTLDTIIPQPCQLYWWSLSMATAS